VQLFYISKLCVQSAVSVLTVVDIASAPAGLRNIIEIHELPLAVGSVLSRHWSERIPDSP
jgi:hypothetical protein